MKIMRIIYNHRWLVFYTLAVMLLTGCAQKKAIAIEEKDISGEYNIFVATDLHYLSPDLNDNGTFFKNMMDQADGKMTRYSEEITEAFLSEVLSQKPDCLILSGDLTFNGEKGSHIALAEKLNTVKDAGIPVLVVPGNHDINTNNAARFKGDGYEIVDSIQQSEFEELYENLRLDNVISQSDTSFSYTFDTGKGYWILVVDVNTEERPGSVDDKTLKWVEEQLKEAENEGIKTITVSHQNIMIHNDMFSFGYQIYNGNELLALYQKYNVPLNLSGHIHIQHIQQVGEVNEIATSSICVYNCQYGIIKLTEKGIDYHTQSVNVEQWAKDQVRSDSNLLNFTNYSEKYFDDITSRNIKEQLSDTTMTDQEINQMTEYAQYVNRLYFSGSLHLLKRNEIAEALWRKDDADKFFGKYLDGIQNESKQDHTVFEFKN